jgi:hypothetical protein
VAALSSLSFVCLIHFPPFECIASLKVLRQLLVRGIAVPTTCLSRQLQWEMDRYRYYDAETSNVITCDSLEEVPSGRRPSTGSEGAAYNWPKPRMEYHLPNDLKHCRDVIELLCHTIPVADINAQPGLPDPLMAWTNDPAWEDAFTPRPQSRTKEDSIQFQRNLKLRKYLDVRRTSCPLLYEALSGVPHHDRIKMLLEMKASPNIVTYMGHNSLGYVMDSTHFAHQVPLLKMVCQSSHLSILTCPSIHLICQSLDHS